MSEAWVGLSDAITQLRAELGAAMAAGTGERLRFELGPVELEFTVDLRMEGGADAGIRWGVVSFGTKGTVASASGHRLKLVLQPKDTDTGQDVLVGAPSRARADGVPSEPA